MHFGDLPIVLLQIGDMRISIWYATRAGHAYWR